MGSEISPPGKEGRASILEENVRWRSAQAPPSCGESKVHTQDRRSLIKILRKLRSCGPSEDCLQELDLSSLSCESGANNALLEGMLLILLR